MISFKNKNILITGASGGIGQGLVKKFVLLGGLKLLQKTKCVHVPIVEKHLQQYGYGFQDILDILVKNNFELFEFVNQKFIRIDPKTYMPHDEDIIAVKHMDDFLKRTKYEL